MEILLIVLVLGAVVVVAVQLTSEAEKEKKKKMNEEHAEEMHKQRVKDINSVIEFASKCDVDISELMKRRDFFYRMATRNYATDLLTGNNDYRLKEKANEYIEKYRNVEKDILNKLKSISDCNSAKYVRLLEMHFKEDYNFFKIGRN